MNFWIECVDIKTKARVGKLETNHGTIETPVFMPVATLGSIKGVPNTILRQQIGAQIILCNTYHLYLRPGEEVINKAGGLHNFIGWKLPILCDSGGYQVYSLSKIRKITEDGVYFQSHIDGSQHFFSPEKVIDLQRQMANDIIMPLDDCAPYPCTKEYASLAMERTHKWLLRSIKHFHEIKYPQNHSQLFFSIVQGSVFSDLRQVSTKFVADLNTDGIAIGGLSVGEPENAMYEMIEAVVDLLSFDRPRYLMGVGNPANILEAISRGIDMFDCVLPTRNGRNGMLFTSEGIINIRNSKWTYDFSPIDNQGIIDIDNIYTKAFLRHAFVSDEMIGPVLATIHNLRFYMWLVETARSKIKDGTFSQWKNQMLPKLRNRL